MSEDYDFAIAGSTPLSGLLAGILARDHGAKVCRIGGFLHEMRPQRGFDISTGPITRPDTWRLLKTTIPETLKHLNAIAPNRLIERTDCMLLSQTPEGGDALAYMRDAAHGYDFEVERLAASERYGAANVHRNCLRVLRRPITAALPHWLEQSGVANMAPEDGELRVLQKGGIRLHTKGGIKSAAKLILAGDNAIATHGDAADMALHFQALPMSALLMQPTGKLTAPIVQAVDAGVTLYQRDTGALDCVGLGGAEEIGQIARAYVDPAEMVRLAGCAVYSGLLSRDGGAVVGASSNKSVIYLGGLGVTGLFQTPAIARLVMNKAETFESDYFLARAPAGKNKLRTVSEFVPPRLQRALK